MNSCTLTTFITTLANSLSCKLSEEELTYLAAVLVQLGDTLATIATHKAFEKNNNSSAN
ncbi:MAG: hypothetical protein IKZ35_05495 [Clostridia bacterium]|nr:hypothetical protein [Clostridia bacterium]